MIQKLFKKRNKERGSGEIIAVLFTIPITMGLIFAGIDVGLYFQTKSELQSITRDSARQVALYGGIATPLKTSSGTVTQNLSDRLWDAKTGTCKISNCVPGAAKPVITCGPTTPATSLNTNAFCEVRGYKYQSVGGGLVSYLGFDSILDNEMNTREQFKVETRF